MPSLIGRFMRDLPFIRQGLVPQEESGAEVKSLDYVCEEHEKLSDDDVQDLARALVQNNAFQGELLLSNNDLTDLTALHLASLFEKQNGHNITKLILDGNNFTTKAGEYIGEVLANNSDYPIHRLSFSGISLESIGLTRIVEACNNNHNLKRVDMGVLTDQGLRSLSELLAANTSLESISFQETKDHQKYWTAEGRQVFVNLLKTSTKIMDVELKFSREQREEDETFVEEIKFYTGMKAREQQKADEYKRILSSCDPAQMFGNLSELIENNEELAAEMPVRKFYNNTFSTLLNRAIFALTKKQS